MLHLQIAVLLQLGIAVVMLGETKPLDHEHNSRYKIQDVLQIFFAEHRFSFSKP